MGVNGGRKRWACSFSKCFGDSGYPPPSVVLLVPCHCIRSLCGPHCEFKIAVSVTVLSGVDAGYDGEVTGPTLVRGTPHPPIADFT